MEIKVFGAGCANCNRLEQMVMDVLAEKDIDASVLHVTDVQQIVAHGIMSTPALAIDGQVKFSGVVPSKAKLTEIITEAVKRG